MARLKPMSPLSTRCLPRCPSEQAFTLLELLVVIAIIAIVCAILIPVTSIVRNIGDRTKCASNLRQVGGAIGGYLGDNDGLLPGPLWTWQSCWYDGGDTATLATALSQYLGLPSDSGRDRADVMLCPAWQRGAPYLQDESFIMNTEVMVDDAPVNPWGDADLLGEDGEPSPDANGADRPKKLVSITPRNGLASTWAMQDLDLLTPAKRVPHGIAPKPVHGDVRNALFMDFHVEPIPLAKASGQ